MIALKAKPTSEQAQMGSFYYFKKLNNIIPYDEALDSIFAGYAFRGRGGDGAGVWPPPPLYECPEANLYPCRYSTYFS